jgi:glycosidase
LIRALARHKLNPVNTNRKPLIFPAAAVLAWLASFLCAAAAPVEFKHGPLELSFSETNGDLLRIACRGVDIAQPKSDVPSVTFAVGPTNKVVWLEQMKLDRRLVGQKRPSPDTLELTVTAGPYELVERCKLHADRARLDRSVRLTNRGADTVKLRGVAFRTEGLIATGAGFYRFPGVWPARSHRFAEMQPGRRHRGRGSIAPALAELSPKQSLLWASFADDPPLVEIVEDKGRFEARQQLNAAGFLRPNEPQEIGFVTMEILDGGYWPALAKMWDWMDSVGLKLPADQPPWVREAMVYSLHPGGTIGSHFKDLGGFHAATERLLPTLPRLGVNAVWIMPVEYRSPYWPLDYYRFMDGLGDGAQYRRLVAKAHELGFHVLQDLVPHGGAPFAVHNKEHPEFMLRREDGSTLDYWLNDFARPDWQRYVARVAAHYVKEYDVDGYRVDACSGSKEMNWDPAIPYARASLATLSGGLGMLRGIRAAVKQLKPERGALLGEVESTRHEAVTDAVYDFGFCYNLCRQWNRMDAGPFVAALQDYLEEQKLSEPRGAVRLRHVESHDSLRAQGWYGVRGLRAMYALSAWIDGVPMIYQGMEDGQAFALAEINDIRRSRPELARGEAFYRAVKCDAPGVFTCLRKLGDRATVVVINFNREPVKAKLGWPGGSASLSLAPLEYTVLPRPASKLAKFSAVAGGEPTTLGEAVAFDGATEWFVDTVEGRLHDAFVGTRGNGVTASGSIYWRLQGTGALWQHETVPLHPTQPQLGYKRADGRWRIYRMEGALPEKLRLAERAGEKPGLHLLGADAAKARVFEQDQLPPAPDVMAGMKLGGVTLRCVGSEYIISNRHFTVTLRRQGGVIRQWRAGGDVLVENQDLYGDQEYFSTRDSKRMDASADVECGARIWTEADGLHLRFEGQLRGDYRFALKRPPLWYRTEYTFNDAPRFTQHWAFRTEKDFKDKKAFLSYFIGQVAADRFRFERDGKAITEGALGEDSGRRGQTKGQPTPDTLVFLREGKPVWSLAGVKTPAGSDCNAFMQAHKFFLTLLDKPPVSMIAGRWHEFGATWTAPAQ